MPHKYNYSYHNTSTSVASLQTLDLHTLFPPGSHVALLPFTIQLHLVFFLSQISYVNRQAKKNVI